MKRILLINILFHENKLIIYLNSIILDYSICSLIYQYLVNNKIYADIGIIIFQKNPAFVKLTIKKTQPLKLRSFFIFVQEVSKFLQLYRRLRVDKLSNFHCKIFQAAFLCFLTQNFLYFRQI